MKALVEKVDVLGWTKFPALSSIEFYINAPHPQHYKSAVHALKYLTITDEYSVSFHSQLSSTI